MKRFRSTLILCAPVLLLGVSADAQIIFVDVDAVGGNNDGSSWSDAYVSLQDALTNGQGSELWVAEGSYAPAPPNGSQALAFRLRNDLALYGGFAGGESARDQRDPGTHVTVLTGDLNGDDQPGWYNMQDNSDQVVVADAVGGTAVIDGFTISSARVTSTYGAAVVVIDASPIIRNCRIERSISDFASGAGVLVDGGSPLMESCSIDGNYVWLARGAGAYITSFSSPTFRYCAFNNNQVHGGGAAVADGAAVFLEFDAPATFDHCSFASNVADPNYPLYSNGGAICSLADGLTILHCDFVGNSADVGGAMWLGRPARIENSRFTGNSAITGGAITNFIANPTTVVGCTFIYNDGQDGGAVSNSTNGVVNFSNSILWGNTGVGDSRFKEQVHNNAATTNFSYCCIEGVFDQIQGEDPPNPRGFPGCTDLEPMFVDSDGADNRGGTVDDDFRLQPTSPCIDAADNTAFLPETLTDLDGLTRFHNDPGMPTTGNGSGQEIADIGAYEFQGQTSGFLLVRPVPGYANARNTWQTAGSSPNKPVYYIYGYTQGSKSVPGCQGLFASIGSPAVLGSVKANGAGASSIAFNVPEAATGKYVYFQAVDVTGCQMSNSYLRLF